VGHPRSSFDNTLLTQPPNHLTHRLVAQVSKFIARPETKLRGWRSMDKRFVTGNL
jgi:hypothetical protein